uniref:Prohormone-3 n=1 Tax=Strigamia maritima TaxID=126957 RepID=T1IXN6_STRMM
MNRPWILICVAKVARLCNAASLIVDAGTCLPMYGARQGDACVQDGDCAAGLVCSDSEVDGTILRTCHTDRQIIPRKQYNERCETSNECNLEKGMCCQIQRRHRQAPRKVCVYYKDTNDCIPYSNPLLEGTKLGPTSGRLG